MRIIQLTISRPVVDDCVGVVDNLRVDVGHGAGLGRWWWWGWRHRVYEPRDIVCIDIVCARKIW